MIARIWRGGTRLEDAQGYVEYIERTGLAAYRATPGNLGAWLLWQRAGELARFVTVSLWRDEAAIRAFAGDDIGRAVFYPEDDRFLVERELRVEHYHAIGGDGPASGGGGAG